MFTRGAKLIRKIFDPDNQRPDNWSSTGQYLVATKNSIPYLWRKDQWRTQEFCSGGGSTNSVEETGQRTGIWGR